MKPKSPAERKAAEGPAMTTGEALGVMPTPLGNYQDSATIMIGAKEMAAIIRNIPEEDDEEDPTPWCHICAADRPETCTCGPYAENH